MTSLDLGKPYKVPSHIKFVQTIVTTPDKPSPDPVATMFSRSPKRRLLWLAGGCAGMSHSDKQHMLRLFGEGLKRFSGMVTSGGTRDVKDGRIDPMVTDVPALLVQQSPRSVLAVTTTPLVDTMGLVDDSRLVLSTDGKVSPNPGVHLPVIIQRPGGMPLGWDGDIEPRFSMVSTAMRYGSWKACMIVFNGGKVTRTEALGAMKRGWPLIIIKGSGRMADQLISELDNGTLRLTGGRKPDRDHIMTAGVHDPANLEFACQHFDLIG